jgi:hypothetical protein
MDREVDIQLVQYRPVQDWKPCLGDIIIRHGWIQRTKWFAVVNALNQDGSLGIVKDGMIRLLVNTPPDAIKRKSENIEPGQIKESVAGSYAIMQHDAAADKVIWYV